MKSITDMTTPKILAYVLVGSLLAIAGGLFFIEVPVANKESFGTILQTLLTLTAAAVFFHVGSSTGSRSKDRPFMDPDAGPIQTKQIETTKVETETRQELKP